MSDRGYILTKFPKEYCNECNFLYFSDGKIPVCQITGKENPYYAISATGTTHYEKPEWCPIKELSEQESIIYEDDSWDR